MPSPPRGLPCRRPCCRCCPLVGRHLSRFIFENETCDGVSSGLAGILGQREPRPGCLTSASELLARLVPLSYSTEHHRTHCLHHCIQLQDHWLRSVAPQHHPALLQTLQGSSELPWRGRSLGRLSPSAAGRMPLCSIRSHLRSGGLPGGQEPRHRRPDMVDCQPVFATDCRCRRRRHRATSMLAWPESRCRLLWDQLTTTMSQCSRHYPGCQEPSEPMKECRRCSSRT